MRPAPYLFLRPADVDDALRQLDQFPDALPLAGGQSLVPQLNLRRVSPPALVDISGLAELRYLRPDPAGGLRIGALTRHADVERCTDPWISAGFGVLAEAATRIGHLPIRVRGTVGGSLAHADPTAHWALLAVGLDAELTLRSVAGERVVPAATFFTGAYTTLLRPGELITELYFPRPAPTAALAVHGPQAGHFPTVAVLAQATTPARVTVSGLTDRPVRLPQGDLPGTLPDTGDEYRREVAVALVARAMAQSARRAAEQGSAAEQGRTM